MRLTDILVDRFGVWRHLALPLRDCGLNVVYGPNEAGKTTLMRFIRGTLYGYDPAALAQPDGVPDPDEFDDDPPAVGGTLRVTHEGRGYEISRHIQGVQNRQADRRDLLVRTTDDHAGASDEASDEVETTLPALSSERRLADLLSDTDERLFRHIFAIGLTELQELATLQDDEVARRIYGLSLGPDGRRLLGAIADSERRTRRSFLDGGHRGEVLRLLARDRELQDSLDGLGDLRQKHADLVLRRGELEDRIAGCKAKQADLRRQLKGHEIVGRVHSPWLTVQECEAELARMPRPSTSSTSRPPDWDWARVETLDEELKALRSEYSRAKKAAIAARRRADAASAVCAPAATAPPQPPIDPHALTLRALVAQRPWVADAEREMQQCGRHAADRKAEFEARHAALGNDWPLARLALIDTSLGAYHRLSEAGRKLTAARARRDRLQKKYKAASELCHQKQTELERAIGEIPESSIEEAIAEAKQRLADGEGVTQLRLREADIEQRITGLQRELARLESRPDLPPWAPGFLLFLAAAGAVLSLAGFVTGLTTNGVAGMILALIGTAGYFIARAFRQHADGRLRDDLAELRMRIRTHQGELRDLRTTLEERSPGTSVRKAGEHAEAQTIAEATRRIKELNRLVGAERAIRARRRKLGKMRQQIQSLQREHDAARQEWCEAVRQVRLPETLDVAEALESWQKVAEAVRHKDAWDDAARVAREAAGRYEQLRQRIETAGRQAGRDQDDYTRPLDVLARWEREPHTPVHVPQSPPVPAASPADSAERERLLEQARRLRREALRLKKRLAACKRKRAELLAEAGVSSRIEFDRRNELLRRRRELEELLALARAELESARKEAPELAIVEHDLRAYNSDENREARELLTLELEELEASLEAACEELGSVKREVTELERDRTASRLRARQTDVRSALKSALVEWAGAETAADALVDLRTHLERDGQPRTLAAASDYLARLTEGRYRRAWVPLVSLDEPRLLVEDDRGESLPVERLSNGTREQLFLAVRLALVEDFAERGVELPMVLDDVLVNFDQHRTETAIETLLEFCAAGRQVLLFTCHLHLAQLCDERGIEPIWLPGHRPLVPAGRIA